MSLNAITIGLFSQQSVGSAFEVRRKSIAHYYRAILSTDGIGAAEVAVGRLPTTIGLFSQLIRFLSVASSIVDCPLLSGYSLNEMPYPTRIEAMVDCPLLSGYSLNEPDDFAKAFTQNVDCPLLSGYSLNTEAELATALRVRSIALYYRAILSTHKSVGI